MRSVFVPASGEPEEYCSDETWKYRANTGKTLHGKDPFDLLCIAEKVENDPQIFGFQDEGFDDSGWLNAVAKPEFFVSKAASPGNLCKSPTPAMRITSGGFRRVVCERTKTGIIRPDTLCGGELTVLPNTECVFELDAGEETNAYIEMKLAGGAAGRIWLLSSECYVYETSGAGSFGTGAPSYPRKGDRSDWLGGHLDGITDEYQVYGTGRESCPEVYEPFFYRTFRYVQFRIRTEQEALRVLGVVLKKTGYPLEVKTDVQTSDGRLDAIWDISLRTLRCCMHDTYIDCPFYERLQYVQDTRQQALFTYQVSADDRLARKAMAEFSAGQRTDGLLRSSYPSLSAGAIPDFSIYFILMVHDHMMYFGDRALVREYIPTIMRILSFFEKRLDGTDMILRTSQGGMGNPYWSFVDWCRQWPAGVPAAIEKGNLTFDNLIVCYGCQKAAELAEYAGFPDIAGHWAALAERLKAAVRKHCRGERGLLKDGPDSGTYSQHVQSFAVLTGTLEGEEARAAMERILDDPDAAKCSVATSFYLFRALERAGLYERTETLWDAWEQMIKNNCTTCVEDLYGQRSECHAWGALALYELPAAVLGLRPTKPGFAEYEVRPVPGYLTWAKGSVTTSAGVYHIQWTREGERLDVKVERTAADFESGKK